MLHPLTSLYIIQMQNYYFIIKWKPRNDMILSDHLNHSHSHQQNLPTELHHNIQHAYFSSDKLNVIQEAAEQDPVHYFLYCLNLNGWPEHMAHIPRITWYFWGTKDELSIKNDILINGDHICICAELFDHTLVDLHEVHQGVKKMQLLTRASVSWPCIDADIANYICKCSALNTKQLSPSSVCYPETYLTVTGKTLQLTISTTKGKITCWYVTPSANTPSYTEGPWRLPSHWTKNAKISFPSTKPPWRNLSNNELPFSSKEFAQHLQKHQADHVMSFIPTPNQMDSLRGRSEQQRLPST